MATCVTYDMGMSRVGLDRLPLGDRYELVSTIGSGASAEVYHATDLRLNRGVAVKQLRSDLSQDRRFQKLFRAEAHLAAQLSHPHIVTVFDWSDDADGVDGGAYIVTELLGGGTLRDILDNGGPFTESQAAFVGLQAAQGLAFAHEQGLVHRDIKPANLLFGVDGRVRIADFGIARAVVEAAWTEPEGVLIGTARYAAPEQAVVASVDSQADVYSLALCLYECLTGEVPLVRDSALGTMQLRQTESVPADSALGALTNAILGAGQADPNKRWHAADLLGELLVVCQTMPDPEPLALIDLTDHRPTPDANVRFNTGGDVIIVGDDGSSDIALPSDDPSFEEGRGESGYADTAVSGSGARHDPGYDTDAPFDQQIVSDDDQPKQRRWGRRLAALSLLILAGGAAAGGWYYSTLQNPTEVISLGIPTFEVEDFTITGSSLDEIKAQAAEQGLTVVLTEQYQDGTEAGDILSQSPAADQTMSPGDELTIVVSLGPELRVVPEIVGKTVDDARLAVTNAKLVVGKVEERADEDVAAGVVLEATIAGQPAVVQSEFITGTTVDLIASSGPAPRVVPSLVGLTADGAAAAMGGTGLNLISSEDFSTTVVEGEIISMSPDAGTSVARGTDVTVVISKGKPFIEVPDVIGLPAAEAADKLEAAGFEVIDTVGAPNGEVLGTDPPAGESYRLGKQIVILTRR